MSIILTWDNHNRLAQAVTGRSNLGSVLYPEVDVPGFNNWVTTI